MSDLSDSYRPGQIMRLLQGRYAFLALLGRGGSGLVFEVENLLLARREALKLFSQGFSRDGSERFNREARIMAALEHPQIVPVFNYGEYRGCFWYAMKLVDGPSLSGLLKARPRPGLAEAFKVAIPLLDALGFTHERGIIHRDIKPANILLDPHAGPILTDYGVAKMEDNLQRTETGVFLGTPAYISPEQGLGRKLDGRTDLYAMGMILHQMLTGRLPFDEASSLATVLQRVQGEAPSPRTLCPDLPEDVSLIVERALARDPDRRHPTAAAMRQALMQAAEAHGLDWREPLVLPGGIGATREPIPGEWGLERETPVSDRAVQPPEVTQTYGPGATPGPRLRPGRRVAWALGVLVGAAVLTAWAAWHWPARSPEAVRAVAPAPEAPPPAHAPPAPASAARLPAPVPSRPPRPAPVEVDRARLPVTPARILEPPQADPAIGPDCAGQTAMVEVQVDESGAVFAARSLSPLPSPCRDAALKAARACRFHPALAADGKPVASTVAIAISL